MIKSNTILNSSPLSLTVVVPVFNECDNIEPLIIELKNALTDHVDFEIIFVDDCSQDNSLDILLRLKEQINPLRVLTHKVRSGQSAAILSGVRAARFPIIATLDGDGQNKPSDILRLLEVYKNYEGGKDFALICGQRKKRKDNFSKRISSVIANGVRSFLLNDKTSDTGCGLKLFRREDFVRLPSFDHMHRFLPALMIRNGGRVITVSVSHRARRAGYSKYGTFDRLWVGVFDLFGLFWLNLRPINPDVKEPE